MLAIHKALVPPAVARHQTAERLIGRPGVDDPSTCTQAAI
jgi:hypothetical protein